MSCESCIKAEDIQKLILEIERLKDERREDKAKIEILIKNDYQRSTDQALITAQLVGIDKKLDEFIKEEFKAFVKEFKENADKPKKRWELIVTGIIAVIISTLGKIGIDNIFK